MGKAKLIPTLLAKVVAGGVVLGVVGDFLVIHDGVGLVVNFGLEIGPELVVETPEICFSRFNYSNISVESNESS